MPILILSDKTINKIAAGEVVERPLSVVKELVENAVDAGATTITIRFIRGGRTLISVSDNGQGIAKDELHLALTRHATSKLDEANIENINFLGFRGEALPSIAAVSKIKLSSKTQYSESAWMVEASNGDITNPCPIAHPNGTTVEVRNLFCFTPSRLRFLKSEASETTACYDMIMRIALAFPEIEFRIIIDNKQHIYTKADIINRIGNLWGEDFKDNMLPVLYEFESVKLHGYISLPTFHQATSNKQYFYVNKRSVRDKLIAGAVKAAYTNLSPIGRYPTTVLFIELPATKVDVNVHPTKAEVRFQDEQKIRSYIIDSIRSCITNTNLRHTTTVAKRALDYMQSSIAHFINKPLQLDKPLNNNLEEKRSALVISPKEHKSLDIKSSDNKDKLYSGAIADIEAHKSSIEQQQYILKNIVPQKTSVDLGTAKCQIGTTYIIAETNNGLVIVDQHAAHERLVLEEMKEQAITGTISVQLLLVPEIVSLDNTSVTLLLEHAESLKEIGVFLEMYDVNQVLVTAVPAILNDINITQFIVDVVSNIRLHYDTANVQERIESIYGNSACKASIKAGRKLSIEEMNAILRQMERTKLSGQCNHGRPTYIQLTTTELKKIFERT